MSGRAWSVGRTAEVAGFARAAARRRDEGLRLLVLVDGTCPRWVIEASKGALLPERSSAEVIVADLRQPLRDPGEVDAAILLVSESSPAEAPLSLARRGVQVALVSEDALDAPSFSSDEPALGLVSVVAGSSRDTLLDKLALWLCSVTDKQIALGACFPFCRTAVTNGLVRRCALQNAGVGAVPLIAGSDFPVMTANQMRLALDVSAVYGRGLEPTRVAELFCVLGGALAWRAFARRILSAAPALGLIARAGVAFGGTMLTGELLKFRFVAPDVPLASRAREKDSGGVGTCLPLASGSTGDAGNTGYVTIGEAS